MMPVDLTATLILGGPDLVPLHGLQLLLNAAWCAAFFGFQAVQAGFVIIASLWFLLLFLIGKTRQHGDGVSTACLLPYVAWITFAAVLNALAIPRAPGCADRSTTPMPSAAVEPSKPW